MPSADRRPLMDHVEAVVFARWACLGAIGGLIGWIAASASHSATPAWLVASTCVIAGVLIGTGSVVWSNYAPPPGSLPALGRRRRTDRESGGLQRVQRTVENGLREAERFNQRMRPWLIELAEQRLRQRASVDPHHDPDSARELLGGSLWQLTQQPLTTAPTQQQLAEWVARIEAL